MDLESESSALESDEDNGDKLVSASKDEKSIELDKLSNSPAETSSPISKGFGLRKWRRLRKRDLVKNTSVNLENSKILKRVLSGSVDPHAKQMHFQSQDVKQDSLGSVGSVNSNVVGSVNSNVVGSVNSNVVGSVNSNVVGSVNSNVVGSVNSNVVGSVNSNVVGFAIAGTSHGTGLAFSAGMDSDNSEDRSSKSSTAASGPKVRYERSAGHSWDKQKAKYFGGKSLISSGDSGQQRKSSVDKSKKLRGERIKIVKENSHSSMESADSKSSKFVFMQGASFSLSSRERGKRRMMDYNEEISDHDAHTSNRKGNVGGEEEEEATEDYSQGDSVGESQIKNNGSSENLDPLTEAFNSFLTLQEVLKKELQKFQELGKETIYSLRDGGAKNSSCIHAGDERASEASSPRRVGYENIGEGLTCLDSEILNLVNNVEHMEIKLEETKRILEAKESQIHELKSPISISEPRNRGAVIGMEDIFQQKMEAEIEHLIFSRSVANLKRRIKLIEEEKRLAENQAHKMLSELGEAETKAEKLKNQAQDLQNHCVEITEIQEVKSFKKRVFKTTSCLLLQLGLLFMLFNFQLMPESVTVVPT